MHGGARGGEVPVRTINDAKIDGAGRPHSRSEQQQEIRSRPSPTAEPDFDLAPAYAVSAKIAKKRSARGERPVGWKIGFTNESTWKDFGVTAPIWGPMYDSTVAEVNPAGAACSIGALLEPRIEPEIALRIAKIPSAEMDEGESLSCIDAVAHGFEIVQSVYPGWNGKSA